GMRRRDHPLTPGRALAGLTLLVLVGAALATTLRPSESDGRSAGSPRLWIERASADPAARPSPGPVRPGRVSVFAFRQGRPPTLARTQSGGLPSFGQPTISGIGGFGFEADLRLDPGDPNRVYESVPGTGGADTSWIWRSLDGGKTFKWVPSSAPLNGKVTPCVGGGDTELAVDGSGRLYFNDLSLANFSTARSDDFGSTFTCSNTGVP